MNVVPLYKLDERHPQALACAKCAVREHALFGALDHDGLDRIHTHIASHEYAADTVILRAGDVGDSLFTIRSGIVRFERSTEAGERRIVRLAGRSDLIGQESLLRLAHQDDVIACTEVHVCRIPRSLVQELGHAEEAITQELMRRWQTALGEAQAWMTNLSTGPAARRMLHLVEKLQAHADGRGLIWLPRREDMGAMLDMTFETASRLVSQLKREGILTLEPPRHARVNAERLRHAIAAFAAG